MKRRRVFEAAVLTHVTERN